MSGGGGKRSGVMFSKPNEPAFLRRLKEQIGYKEGPTVDTKKESLPLLEPEDERDRDDEKPTIVTLNPGDLTADEVEELGGLKDEDEELISGKVKFRKPVKRAAGHVGIESKLPEDSGSKKIQKLKSTVKQVKNKSLLSFDEEEDDDD